jgi:hypothetical protein
MIFSVARTEDPDWEIALYIILKGNDVFLEGIQERSEADAIAELLNHPLKVVPINAHAWARRASRRDRTLA